MKHPYKVIQIDATQTVYHVMAETKVKAEIQALRRHQGEDVSDVCLLEREPVHYDGMTKCYTLSLRQSAALLTPPRKKKP